MNQVSGGAPGSLGSRAYSGRWRTGKRVFRFFSAVRVCRGPGFRVSGIRWQVAHWEARLGLRGLTWGSKNLPF